MCTLIEWPIIFEGTKSMPLIWIITIVLSALLAAIIGMISLKTTGVYFIMITLAFAQMLYIFQHLGALTEARMVSQFI